MPQRAPRTLEHAVDYCVRLVLLRHVPSATPSAQQSPRHPSAPVRSAYASMSEAHAPPTRIERRGSTCDSGWATRAKAETFVRSASADNLPQYHRDQVGEARRVADGRVPVRDDEHQPVCTRIVRAAAQLQCEQSGLSAMKSPAGLCLLSCINCSCESRCSLRFVLPPNIGTSTVGTLFGTEPASAHVGTSECCGARRVTRPSHPVLRGIPLHRKGRAGQSLPRPACAERCGCGRATIRHREYSGYDHPYARVRQRL